MKAIDMARRMYPEMMFMDGMDDAFAGVIEIAGGDPVACYNYNGLIEIAEEHCDDHESAKEYVDYNIVSAYHGVGTPAILYLA